MIRVVLIEDHPLMRAGIRNALSAAPDIDLAGEAGTAEEGRRLVCSRRPDVVLLDIGLPDSDGIALLSEIAATGRSAVVMLSCHGEERFVRMAMDAGASGYLTKSAAPRELVGAVRDAARGRVPLSADVAALLVAVIRGDRRRDRIELTRREREVWRLLASGETNATIAGRLFISEHTVKFHVHNLLRKLGLKSRAEAICAAHRRGLAG